MIHKYNNIKYTKISRDNCFICNHYIDSTSFCEIHKAEIMYPQKFYHICSAFNSLSPEIYAELEKEICTVIDDFEYFANFEQDE